MILILVRLNLSSYEQQEKIKKVSPKTQLAPSNNKFIKSVNSQVCEKLKNYTNHPIVEFEDLNASPNKKPEPTEIDE